MSLLKRPNSFADKLSLNDSTSMTETTPKGYSRSRTKIMSSNGIPTPELLASPPTHARSRTFSNITSELTFHTPKSSITSPKITFDGFDLNSPLPPKSLTNQSSFLINLSNNIDFKSNFKIAIPNDHRASATAPSSAKNTILTSTPSPSSKNIKVICRFRPLIAEEIKSSNFNICANFIDASSVEITDLGLKQQFTFDRIFGPNCLQEEIYESLGRDIVLDVLQFYNATVFSYGQTSAGKTYTMQV